MSTSLRRDSNPEPAAGSPGHLEAHVRRPTCQEEVAGRARERTNAHGTTPPPTAPRERVGYATRELERLSRGLAEQAEGLRGHGEDAAADKLARTASELLALSQAIAASRRV